MKKILVVEDDQFLASAYKLKLDKLGYDVRLAGDGDEALLLVETFSPDIILLDLVMPKRDGFSVLSELKSNDDWKNIPVLVASNLSQKDDIDRAMKMGAVGYVVKTGTSVEDFMLKLRSILKE